MKDDGTGDRDGTFTVTTGRVQKSAQHRFPAWVPITGAMFGGMAVLLVLMLVGPCQYVAVCPTDNPEQSASSSRGSPKPNSDR